LQEVKEGGLATPEGLAYLEAKHLAVSLYTCCIVAYLLLKAEGRSVRNHPVIGRWAVFFGFGGWLLGGSRGGLFQCGAMAVCLFAYLRWCIAACRPTQEANQPKLNPTGETKTQAGAAAGFHR
jgi:hypothetical protein